MNPIPAAMPPSTLQARSAWVGALSPRPMARTIASEHPDEQREQHDPEQGRSAGQEAPAEVGAAAGERREQAQDDGRDRRPAELVHAAEPAAMQPTAAAASAIPTACDRVTRSRRTTVARMTVVTG